MDHLFSMYIIITIWSPIQETQKLPNEQNKDKNILK